MIKIPHIGILMPTLQVGVRCPRGPGAAIAITPQGARTPDWPAQTHNPAMSPRAKVKCTPGLPNPEK